MKILSVAWEKLTGLFKSFAMLKSSQQQHFVNHIHDETITWPNGALMWCNVHGFEEGNWQTYWLGLDARSFGIRVADYVLKFKSKSLYNEYLSAIRNDPKNVLSKMRNDSRLFCSRGNNVNVEFVFKWGGDEKKFDVHLSTDDYAEEK